MTGRLVPRQYVVLSDGERHCLLVLQKLAGVQDIREQFPLWPLEATQAIAQRLGFKHPAIGGVPQLMTTDFLVTLPDGDAERLQAISFKPSKTLDNRRVQEKLDIERVYWQAQGESFNIVTELDLPDALVRNLEWIDERYDLAATTMAPELVPVLLRRLLRFRAEKPELSLSRACGKADSELGLEPGACLSGFRHALARGLWEIPLGVEIDPLEAVGTLLARVRRGPGMPSGEKVAE